MRFAFLLAAVICLAATPAAADDTIGLYGDTGSGLSRAIDPPVAAPFDIVVVQTSFPYASASEFAMTELTQLYPTVLKLNTWKYNNTTLDLGDNSQGEYVMAYGTCATTRDPFEIVRVTYFDIAGSIGPDTVLEVGGTAQSSCGGEPCFVGCYDNVKYLMDGVPPSYTTGANVLVPYGAVVLNGTGPIAPNDPTLYYSFAIAPKTFNKARGARKVSLRISQIGPFGLAAIAVNTLRLNDVVAPIPGSAFIDDSSGEPVLKVSFPSDQFGSTLQVGDAIVVKLSGELLNGDTFLAYQTIKVLDPQDGASEPLVSDFEASASPNPFNPSTTFTFRLPEAGYTELSIYDVSGRKVKTLVQENVSAGQHERTWDGRDDSGSRVATGVYYYLLQNGDHRLTKRVVLIK